MPSTQTLLYLMAGIVVLFIGIIIAYLILRKKMQSSEYAQIKKLQEGTKASSFSLDIFYQKMYLIFIKTPFLKRYILKVRRRLEILHVDD